jgi:serine/threonine protein kinase
MERGGGLAVYGWETGVAIVSADLTEGKGAFHMMSWLRRLAKQGISKITKEVTSLDKSVSQLLKVNRYRIPTFFGELELKTKPLGSGGNASVYEVVSPISAAIKILPENIKTKQTKKFERFLEEYRRIVVNSHHPGIVRLYHYEQIVLGDTVFPAILMEKCDQNLKDWRKQANIEGKLTLKFIRDWIRNFCNTLQYIHNAGIVHRDIKPENILVRSNGDFVLADFGIAWFDPEIHKIDLTTGNERLANFLFSAPEQVPGASYLEPTPATDIFALGQLVCWMITGQTIQGTNSLRLSEDFRPLEQLIREMTQRERRLRIQTAADVIDRLKETDRDFQFQKRKQNAKESIDAFSDCLARQCPGISTLSPSVHHYTLDTEINRIIFDIADRCCEKSLMIQWEQWLDINRITKLGTVDGVENCFLIQKYEAPILELWVVRCSASEDHEYVVLKCGSMPAFNTYQANLSDEYSEAAWFLTRYVTRSEYDDGAVIIDGCSVALNGQAEIRCRVLKGCYWILSSKFGAITSIYRAENESILKLLKIDLDTAGTITESVLSATRLLPKHSVFSL